MGLTVLYDPSCGLCRRVHEWLTDLPKLVELNLVPIKSDEARGRFPNLNHELTTSDLTVISEQGAVYFDHGSLGIERLPRMVVPVVFTGVVTDHSTRRVHDLAEPLPD